MMAIACGSGSNNGDNNGTNNGDNNGVNNGSNNGTVANNGVNNGTNNGTVANNGTNNGTNNATNNGVVAGWTEGVGPCPGSRTDAVLFRDRNTGYVGCGFSAEGTNLYKTEDGGNTWESLRDWGEIRVFDIVEANGTTYVTGLDTSGASPGPLWFLDDNDRLEDSAYEPTNDGSHITAGGENIAVTSLDEVILDAFNQRTAAFRDEAGVWSSFVPDFSGTSQVIAAAGILNDRYIAVGSTINDGIQVHLPAQDPAAGKFQTQALELDLRGDGTLQDLIVWDDGEVLVVGTNESSSEPVVYLGSGDLYDAANWALTDLFDQGIEYDGKVWAISNQGDSVVAVGERIPTSQGGFVLLSEDRGRTWTDITPTEASVNPLNEVNFFPNGDIIAFGGGGELWSFSAQ